jgi:hypothetical protein
MSYWSQNDLEAAHDWARTHADRLTDGSLSALARNLASRSDLAKQAVSWVPAEKQRAWILSVAQALARNDIDDTLQWLSRYSDEPVYKDAVQLTLESLVSSRNPAHPAWAARFLDGQSAEVRARAIAIVANAWARQDPAAAARWVQSAQIAEADEARRTAAFDNIASRWAERDPDAASEWARRLDDAEQRDRALTNVLIAGAEAGRVDTQVIAAFSTDQRRERALSSALPRLGQSDPDRARRLIAQYLTDPTLRAQAEAALLRGRAPGPLGVTRVEVIAN